MEHYVGIDVSLEWSSICVVDGVGKVMREAKVFDAAEEGGVLVVLDDPRSAFWCQWRVDGARACGRGECHRVPPSAQSLHWPVERGRQ